MYEEHFNLSGAPFKLNPDPKYFFGSRSHNKAMAYLHYGLKQAEGFIVITGPIGSGKTMVISQLLDQLASTNVIAAQLLTSNIAPEELLDHILSAFRIEPEGEGRTGKLEALEDYLFDQLNRGRRVLLIMDEAQNLPFETLEELRMLSNIDYDGTPLFQVFLVGQPEFRELLQTQRLEQLRQRVIASYHLENLSFEETKEYILHRLAISGWNRDPLFTDGAFNVIHTETGGRPRRINTVCNRVMLFCSLEDAHEVTADIATQVVAELHEEELDARDVAPEKPADEAAEPAMKAIDEDTGEKPGSDAVENEETEPADAERVDVAQTEMTPTDDRDDDHDNEREEIEADELAAQAEGVSDMKMDDMDDQETPSESDLEEIATADQAEEALSASEENTAEETTPEAASAPSDEAQERAAEQGDGSGLLGSRSTSGDGSVLDRIRAKRATPVSASPSQADAPEATLEDVAAAIASANVGAELSSDPSAPEDALGVQAAIAPLQAVQSKEWRRQVRDSIDETRGELKDAHASVRRLRKSLTDMQRQRNTRREKIVAGLQRAEAMLNQVRKDLF